MRSAILRKASSSEIKQIAIKNGMVTMLADGFRKAAMGLTTIEEVLRVTYD
jgi:type II secretory ATPase GspE/PulE/Tfp pilus assembly ATPase PilB-like protein